MATPNVFTQNNLDYARSLLDQGRVSGMYDYLAAQGYQYARLANGVARGDSPAGLIALEFMENTAQAQGHTLSEAEVNSIRGDMANGYLRALQQQLDNSTTDTVSRDITADEAWSFHSDVFQNHHLSADAWTLNTPFEIIVDSAARQAYWQQVLNAAGDPVAEASLSVGTYVSMSINTAITSPENADKARSWLLRLDNLETYADVVGALGLQFDKVASTFGDRVFDATNSPSIAALAKASASIVGSLFYGWSFALDLATGDGINQDLFRGFLEARKWDGELQPAIDSYQNAKYLMSPIILDLDRDGVETTGVRDGAHFDHEGDGFAEQTGWVGKDDGLLVWDRDGDGFINDGSELFGSRTKLTNGSLAANGFAALSELDSNRDGKVDAADSSFTSLRVWKDVDGNGISAPDELLDLSAVGVQSITTSYLNSSNLDQNGNDHRQLGSYTRADGTTANAEDVWFKVDRTYSIATETVAVPDDVSVLPYLSGYGLVRDLHQAMASDASGELKSLVSQFSSATSIQQREALLESILFKWSGADAYSPDSRGPFIGDARKLYAVEAFIGEPFIQLAHDSPNPYQDASRNILAAYQNIFESYYTSLTAQTELKPVLELISYHWDAENASFVGDLSEVAVYLNNLISQDRISGKEELSETARVLRGLGFLDKLNTSEFRQSFEGVGSDVTTIIDSLWSGLVATGGNDKLNGTSKNDILEGLGGNDWLEGFDGDDVLNGGIGNDAIYGGTGNDIYLFERGFGQDNVYEFDWTLGNTDVIRFLGDISPSEVVITRDANSLYLNIDGTQDRIAIWDWFGNAADRRIERVEFTDGTIWNPADLESRITARPATEFADVFYGGVASDSISGLGGNDIIYANSGDDVISGDGGNDNLEGGAGNDTYLFGRGHGQDTVFDNDSTAGNTDTIRYVDDIAPSEVSVKRDERNLYLEIQGTSDRITLRDWFVTTNGQIERVEFFNGTVWTLDDLNAKASTPTEGADYLVGTSTVDTISGGGGDDQIYGDAGDDVLFGGDGNDRIEGGTGNDTLSGGGGNDSLYGGSGSDIYLFGRGGGQDTIYETDGTEDKVCFDADVLPGDVRVTRDAWNNLTFSIQGTSDKLVVSGWFSGSASRIEKVEFSDGTVWDSAALVNLSATPTDQYDYIFGTDGADVSNGLQGNDEIYGGAGADVLAGGVGNDVLSGGAGNDVYIFQRGDGQDKVYDYDWQAGNIDTIRFGPDNLPDDIKVISQGRDLTLAISGTSDRITIQNWYDSAATRIEQITFANGTTWIADDVQARAVVAGTDGADDLYGTAGNDVIDGGAGNDVLYGYSGYSGLGDDAYIFSVGSGSDTVIDYDTTAGNLDTIKVIGKLPSEVTLSRSISGSSVTNDLVITINGTTDKLTVANYFAASGYKVERVEFDNGTVWDTTVLDAAQILPTAAGALYGTAGNDVIDLRNAAATTVYGPGAGNNTGNDTYLFCAGAGQDVINDYDTTAGNLDTIKVIGKLPSEVTLSRSISGSSVTNDLVITINGTTDKLTVANYFAASGYKVERVEFDNGTVWDTTVLDAAQILPTAAGALYGTAGNDVIDLRNAAATTVYGPGAGNNTGNDTYLFCAGAGQDVINDYDTTAGNLDTIKVIGKLPSEVTLSRSISGSSVTNDLVITINGTTDKLTVANYFAASGYKVERVEFDNGTVWDTTVLDAAQILPTAAGALYGTAGNDVIDLRNAAATTVYGPGAGNNTGNDTYLFCAGAGQDVINDYDTTAGNLDTIKVIGKLPSEVTLSRSISGSSVTNDLVITINGTTDKLTVANYFAASGYKVERVEFDNGTVWDTTVLDAAQILPTAAGALYGTAGNDVIDLRNAAATTVYGPGAGNNTGNDTYLFCAGAGQDVINDYDTTAGNLDTIKVIGKLPSEVTLSRSISGSSVTNDLVITINGTTDKLTVANYFAASGYKVERVEFDNGTVWDTTVLDAAGAVLVGTVGADSLSGSVGNDTLDGGTGVDVLVGGSGNDTYLVDLTATNALQDTVTEAAGGGVDTLILRGGTVLATVATVTLGADVDNLDASHTVQALLNLTGNSLDNTLNGNAAANTLNGGVGNNTLDGGAGVDTLVGGAGNDAYVVDLTATNGLQDTVTEVAGGGVDTLVLRGGTVLSTVATVTLGAEVNNLDAVGTGSVLLNLTGNALNNVLTGNAAANVLNGGAGADTLVGGAGNDTYVLDNAGDSVIENVEEGIDLIQVGLATAGGSYALGANLENGTLTNTVAYNLTGNALDNILIGNAAANTLVGGTGNDTLDGGAGNDILQGGLGDDTYTIDVLTDTVTEVAEEGTDLVKVSIATAGGGYVLGANLENGTLINAVAYNLTGNALDNVLIGNAAANVLNGGAGADTLVGSAGNDTYVVDNDGDVVIESSTVGTEIDVVQSSVNYTLGSNVENLTLTGGVDLVGIGNALNNTITGNTGNNALDGGAGVDTLVGGAGNDAYVVDLTATNGLQDTVTEVAGGGVDTLVLRGGTVLSTVATVTLGAEVNNLDAVGTGSVLLNLTGNALNNVLTGNAAANVLNGGAGADTLVGGAGNDTYVLDNAGDSVIENVEEGIDLIQVGLATAGGSYALGANLENGTLTNTVAYNLTGNALDNILIGNAAANTLVGGTGNDTLDGGAGNDILQGGLGDDTYTIDVLTDTVTEVAEEGTDLVKVSIATAGGGYVLGANLENGTLINAVAYNLTGNALDNVLIGNAAANVLNGGVGNDTLDGKAGSDTLMGGTGDDTYVIGRGYGNDTASENDATVGNTDVVQFLNGISTDQIWLRHTGNNLEVSVIGTTDKLTIENWYTSSTYHVEQLTVGDGKVLLDTQVEVLVQAMAAFAPPAAGQTTLPQNYQDALAPVIAANWQ